MPVVFANRPHSALQWSASLLYVLMIGLWHVTPSLSLSSQLTCDDTDGLRLFVCDVDETEYSGMPYVQDACQDHICGQNGDMWTRYAIGTNVTWEFHLTIALLEDYHNCSQLVNTGMDAYYMTKIVLPRHNSTEMESDYIVELRCHHHDSALLTPPVPPAFVAPLDNPVKDMGKTAGAPYIQTFISRVSTGDMPTGEVVLGERLRLNVLLDSANGGLWDQVRVMSFYGWNPDRTHHLHIVEKGCPTEEGLYVNAQGAMDYLSPVYIDFDAFRFKEEESVVYTLDVRVCKSGRQSNCTFGCGTFGRRKRSAISDHTSAVGDAPVDAPAAADTSFDHSMSSASDLLAARAKDVGGSSDLEISEIEIKVKNPIETKLEGRHYIQAEYDGPVIPIDSTARPGDDVMKLKRPQLTTDRRHTQLTNKWLTPVRPSHPPGVCLDVVQLSVVCALLLLVLLIGVISTAYFMFKTMRCRCRRRHRGTVNRLPSASTLSSSSSFTYSAAPCYGMVVQAEPTYAKSTASL